MRAGPLQCEKGGQWSPYFAQPFKQAFCMASMVYRRNSCASSWFPKRKCRAISTEGRKRRQTGRGAPASLHTTHGRLSPAPTWPRGFTANLCKVASEGTRARRELSMSHVQLLTAVLSSVRAEGLNPPHLTEKHPCLRTASTQNMKSTEDLVSGANTEHRRL